VTYNSRFSVSWSDAKCPGATFGDTQITIPAPVTGRTYYVRLESRSPDQSALLAIADISAGPVKSIGGTYTPCDNRSCTILQKGDRFTYSCKGGGRNDRGNGVLVGGRVGVVGRSGVDSRNSLADQGAIILAGDGPVAALRWDAGCQWTRR
jgi:hypothetical protein